MSKFICKKGIIEGSIFTTEQGDEYELSSYFAVEASNCYIQLEKVEKSKYFRVVRIIHIKN